ncbi:MAG: carboxypeptidase regulatory-like domain-containing protein, partial [Gammaproteobacteria bacterium]
MFKADSPAVHVGKQRGRYLRFSILTISMLAGSARVLAGSVEGHVSRAAVPNDPIANAHMTLFTPSLSFFKESRSDGQGFYRFDNLPAGSYQLGCAALRFEYVEITVGIGGGATQHDFALASETQQGRWDIIGNTAPEVLDATDIAVLLPSGEIFYCHDTQDPILFDPMTGAKSFPSGSNLESGCMNGSLLPDGTVIFAGGQDGDQPGEFVNAVRWVKKFTPGSDTWMRLADLQHPLGRWYPGMTRLADGSFLVMGGGQCCNAARTDTAERFDLTTQTWTYTGSMINPAEFPPSALLYTGEVLITWSPPQLYNPTSGLWRLTGNFNQPNRGWPDHSDHSLIMLNDGR